MHSIACFRPLMLFALLLPAAFTGCVSSKFATIARGPATPLELSGRPDPLRSKVEQVIVRHGPGSWKREAFWDEYQLSFVNHHSVPVMIVSIRLVDAQDSNHEAGDNWYALEADSRSTWSRTALRQNLGIGARSLAVGVGRVATLVGAVAGSLAMHGFTLAAPGTAALAIPLVTETMRDANETKEREITNEFDARRIQLPATMAPGARLNGSAFFRISPSPRQLLIHYQMAGEHRVVTIDLAPIEGYHANQGMFPAPAATPLAPLAAPSS